MNALASVRVQPACVLRSLAQVDYAAALRDMQAFTAARDDGTADEIWLLEHEPVYTAGLNTRAEHFPAANPIPLIQCDRGGQVTYHGPGQLIAYCLLDLNRMGLGVRQTVTAMEQALIDLLARFDISGHRVVGAPGVYVEQRKIAALGLRIRHGRSYHGLSLNIDMNLAPFKAIDPCGYRGLQVTQLRDLGVTLSVAAIGDMLAELLMQHIQGAHPR